MKEHEHLANGYPFKLLGITYLIGRENKPFKRLYFKPTELLGRSVQKWFLQLRRLQSLLHALRAGKSTANAQIYPMELWHAIRTATGFHPDFRQWWTQRPVQLQGSPEHLPLQVPPVDDCERIFADYQINYKFERWHAGQRQSLLDLTLQSHRSRIFQLGPLAK